MSDTNPTAAAATEQLVPSATATAASSPQAADAHDHAEDEAAVPAVGGKRGRTALSLHEKAVVKSFCEHKAAESKARGELAPSQEQLRREVAAKFGWACGRSTLSKIVSMDWARLQQGALQNPNMKRQRRPLFPALEADLVAFIAQFLDSNDPTTDAMVSAPPSESPEALTGAGSAAADRARGSNVKAVLTEALILEEAQRLKQVHGIKDEQLVLSVGWLARFKHRHGIRLRKPPTSSRVTDKRDAMTPGATGISAPGGVEAVAWSHVDPLLLTTPSSMLDALHAVDSDAITSGKSSNDVQVTSTSSSSPLNQKSDGVQDALTELLSSISSPSPLCELGSTSETAPDKRWQSILDNLPSEIRTLACHCSNQTLHALALQGVKGLRIVTVGANSTVDAFIAAAIVGDQGHVSCIESVPTTRQLGARLAAQYERDVLQYTDSVLEFVGTDGLVPGLDSLQGTADLVQTNCSLQTSEPSVMERALEVCVSLLKPGGELKFTTVCGSRRLSTQEINQATVAVDATKEKFLLHSPYYVDMCLLCQHLGRQVDVRTITRPLDASSSPVLGDLKPEFYRCDYRLFTVQDMEPTPEDYGQVAVYTGGSSEDPSEQSMPKRTYRLDDDLSFLQGDRVPVDGNTAKILQSSWLREIFTVEGDTGRHTGGFHRVGALSALITRSRTTNSSMSAPSEPVADQ